MYIGIISDTHGYLHPKVLDFLKDCDQIWHAGDIGNIQTLDKLCELKPFIGVYGNIDDCRLRNRLGEFKCFMCEDLKVMLTHIGGYPSRYSVGISNIIKEKKPDLFVCGHSHILRVMRDNKHNLMYINPGAAGNVGLHKNITALRLRIEGKRLFDLEVLDIERKN